jgi:predicted metal-dependent peptidase
MERYDLLALHAKRIGGRPRPRPADGGERDAAPVDDHRHLRSRVPSSVPGSLTQTAMMLERALEGAPPRPTKEQPRTDEDDAEIPRRFTIAGRDPGRLLEELRGTTLPPSSVIDWKSALAMFVARARAPVYTWARPNRRFPDRVFAVPGRTWLPRRIDAPRLLVALDTSLSMTTRELEEIARQLTTLAERAHVTVAECDVEITRVYPFAGRIDSALGRGGTDLRPIFEPSILRSLDVDGVVYFTDGDGPFPERPAIVPTLWILTKPQQFACPWGERARLRVAA